MSREIDRAVAERVMRLPSGVEDPLYSIDPAADYTVLVKVRTDWVFSKRQRFGEKLDEIFRTRTALTGGVEAYPDRLLRYEPGDYSRAALAALEAAP